MALAEPVLDSLKEVVFQKDASGNWVLLNQTWQEMTGFDAAGTLGKSFIDYVRPDDREQCPALFRPLLAGAQGECRHEMRYLHRDGSLRLVEAFARPALHDAGKLGCIAGTLTDITKRKPTRSCALPRMSSRMPAKAS